MSATTSSDFVFEPKVWHDHVSAYFDQKLVYGAFAIRDYSLVAEKTGLTVNFPFYNKIGAAEKPSESASLTVDSLSDDSFSATVFEAGKAVGIKKKAFKKSADSVDGVVSEAQGQMARVHAELVDNELNTEITNSSNYDAAFSAASAENDVRRLNAARISVFGDKMSDADVCFMHSLMYLDVFNDTTAGMLKADANDPAWMIEGFQGRLLGMAIVVVDTCPTRAETVGSKGVDYLTHFHKMASYGIMEKQEIEFDEDKDILARERIFTSNQWYAVKSFHKKISSDDKRAGGYWSHVR